MSVQTYKTLQNNRDKNKHIRVQKALRLLWLGRRDSNPRMLGSKPSALPLGDALLTLVDFTLKSLF